MNEYQQPYNPMQIVVMTKWSTSRHPVFGVKVDDTTVTYLTIDGNFYDAKDIAYAEVLIEQSWYTIDLQAVAPQ